MSDYPTEEQLAKIRTWPSNDPKGWFAFIKAVWWSPDWGWTEQALPKGAPLLNRGTLYAVSTGGWSGNEEIIAAMQKHESLWLTTWESSRRGGHYEFEVTP